MTASSLFGWFTLAILAFTVWLNVGGDKRDAVGIGLYTVILLIVAAVTGLISLLTRG